MKLGDLVSLNELQVGIIVEYIPYENRLKDPFPHWKVLFLNKILHCRESDLKVVL